MFKNLISIFFLEMLRACCCVEKQQAYTTNPLEYTIIDPLEYNSANQAIYKLNKAEDLFWKFTYFDRDTINSITIEDPWFETIPGDWRQEILNDALKLYDLKLGE